MSLRVPLLLLVLAIPVVWAQAPLDDAALPEGLPAAPGAAQAGIEATGDTTEVRELTEWADQHLFSDPEQAGRVTQRALALAEELDDQKGIGKSLLILGNLAPNLNQKEAYFTDAQEAFEQIGDEHGVLRSRLNIGTVYQSRGELEQTLNIYFNVLRGFERLGDTERQAITLNNIANTYRSQDNWEESVVYHKQAVALAETLDKPGRLVYMLSNYGTALGEQGAYEYAEETFRRALALSEEEDLPLYSVGIYNNLGALFNEQGRHEDALPFLLTAKRLSQELGEDQFQFIVYDELGKAYMGLGEYDRALHYALENLVLTQKGELDSGPLQLTNPQMTAHKTLSKIYEVAGNHEQALLHYQQYAAARDSTFTAEKAGIIADMQTRYETEEKQRAIERLEYESQRRLILFLAGVGGLLLLLGFLYYRYRIKQRANRLLEELDAAKSRFFANISHEFRTPLTVILGGLQDALAGRFGTLSKDLAVQNRAMLRNTRQLQRLIDEVLDLNRLEAGKLALHLASGDLVRLLRRLIEADAPLAERNGIDLTFEHDVEQCPRLYDKAKLEKIVGNLLSNALKFTQKGGLVRVELDCNSEVEITVSDDGPGIPAEMQEKVFERFAQVEDGSHHGGLPAASRNSAAQAGTGIGLALAKELVELHDGMITLESEPGKGSVFTVRLPLEEVALDDIQGAQELPFSRKEVPIPAEKFDQESQPGTRNPELEISGDGAAPSGQPETEEADRTTVLIIEDNDDVRAFVRRSLEEVYRVLEAADGETGLQQARTELPDLIVSDVMLPGIDGYEVAKRLKAEGDTECIPVVMLTARAAEEDQTEGYGSGAEVYITKPLSPDTLRAAIARLLEERLRLRRRLQEDAKQEGDEASQNGHQTLSDRARAAVLEHLHDENFGVEELAAALGMTRRTLYNRFKAEVGLTPNDFVRTLRLERARELLTGGAGSISEVAYAVGFNSLAVFSRTYRAHYGAPPSEHLGREKNALG